MLECGRRGILEKKKPAVSSVESSVEDDVARKVHDALAAPVDPVASRREPRRRAQADAAHVPDRRMDRAVTRARALGRVTVPPVVLREILDRRVVRIVDQELGRIDTCARPAAQTGRAHVAAGATVRVVVCNVRLTSRRRLLIAIAPVRAARDLARAGDARGHAVLLAAGEPARAAVLRVGLDVHTQRSARGQRRAAVTYAAGTVAHHHVAEGRGGDVTAVSVASVFYSLLTLL